MSNKIALVTGGSRGLGKDMVLNLVKEGLGVIFTYHSNRAAADAVITEMTTLGGKAVALQLDTSDTRQFHDFEAQLSKVLQDEFNTTSLDFIINNAGIGNHTPFEAVTEAAFDQLVNIHFKGVYFLTQKLVPMLNAGGGIINISSGLARFSHPNTSLYASVKGAIEVFTRVLAVELGPKHIRVNTVAPGAIATDFNGGTVRDNEQVNAAVAKLTALGRVGEPEDIGGVVAFLCTDAARWINGQRIEVSGGMHL